jgi:hypothetical protein
VKIARRTLTLQPGGEYRNRVRQAVTLKFGEIENLTEMTRLTGDDVPCSETGGKNPEITLFNKKPLSELNCCHNELSELLAWDRIVRDSFFKSFLNFSSEFHDARECIDLFIRLFHETVNCSLNEIRTWLGLCGKQQFTSLRTTV